MSLGMDDGPGMQARFGGGALRGMDDLAREDAARSEALAQACKTRSARGLPPVPKSHAIGVRASDFAALEAWEDPNTCAFCGKPLNIANKAGRENKTGVCRGCHDQIGGNRRAAVMYAVAQRRKEITV